MPDPQRHPVFLLSIYAVGPDLRAVGVFGSAEALSERPAICRLLRRQLRDMERRVRADRRRTLLFALPPSLARPSAVPPPSVDTEPACDPLGWSSEWWPDGPS